MHRAGEEVDDDSFLIYGMQMEGAVWDQKTHQLALTEDISSTVGEVLFKWVKVEKAKQLSLGRILENNSFYLTIF